MQTAVLVAFDVLLIFVVSRALRIGLDRLRQPAVMAEVCAGLLLGASVLGAFGGNPTGVLFPVDARQVLSILGQVALVAYLFGVGSRFDASTFPGERRAIGLVAVSAFAVPFAAGAALALGLHDQVAGNPPRLAFVLFLGTALAVTALPVLARIVDVRGLANRPAGRVALGAAAAQELFVWPLLAVAVALAADGRSPAAVAGLGVASVALVVVLARVVPAKGVVVLAGLAASAVATELAGLHLVIGAILFSVALPAGRRDLGLALLAARPARVAGAVLLPVFFALPGLGVDLGTLGGDGLALIALVLVVAVTAKLSSATAAARAGGLGRDEARSVGILMNARGLVELVVLTVGREAGLVDDRLFAVMVLMALATTFATGPLLNRVERRASRPMDAALGLR